MYHGESIIWTPEEPGGYQVTLTVFDDDGESGFDSYLVLVEPKQSWIYVGAFIILVSGMVFLVKHYKK